MGETSTGILVAAVVTLLAISSIVWMVVRHRRRLAAMSDLERERYDAVLEYERNIKVAEKSVRAEEKARESRLKTAERRLKSSGSVGRQHLGTYSGAKGPIRIFQHELVLPEGTYPMDDTVRAAVDTAGNLATSSRATLTRMAAGGLMFGPVGLLAGGLLKKNKTHDMRELYLMLEGAEFATLVACRAEDGQQVRQLAAAVNHAAKSASAHRQEHEEAVASATEQLRLETLNTGSLTAAKAALKAARANRIRVETAELAISANAPSVADTP
jgi:hypothetical protein